MVGGNRDGDAGEWTREPPDRTGAIPSRLRRRAPAIQGSADRRPGSTDPSADPSVRRVRQTPNEGGTAEGTAFRPWDDRPFLIPGPHRWARTAAPPLEATTRMTTTDPLSLTEAKRLVANADTILLRATRDADLETPIGAFLRLDDGGPAYLLESVEGGERLGRY